LARRRKIGYYSRLAGFSGSPASGAEWAARYSTTAEQYIEDWTSHYRDNTLRFARDRERLDQAAYKVEAWWTAIRKHRGAIREAVAKAKDEYYRLTEAIHARKTTIPAP